MEVYINTASVTHVHFYVQQIRPGAPTLLKLAEIREGECRKGPGVLPIASPNGWMSDRLTLIFHWLCQRLLVIYYYVEMRLSVCVPME